jgi:glycosyltransferase involved in cell wall biosynthesis
MKILFVTEINPFPPLGGDTIRAFNIIKALQSFASVHLVVLGGASISEKHNYPYVETVSHIAKDKKPGSGLMERLRPFKNVLTQLETANKQIKPDIVWLEYTYIAHYQQAFPECPIIFDSQNVQSEIDRQLAVQCDSNLLKKAYAHLVWKASVYHERKYLPTCDAVLAVSQDDLAYYKSYIEPKKLWLLPNFIELLKYTAEENIQKCSQPTVVFTGSMDAFQNQKAGEYLLEKIWTQIAKEIPDAQLFIVGKNPPQHWLDTPRERVKVTGKVDSTVAYIKAAHVAIVPVLDGSGTRYKILEAMACGVPAVSTSLGAQGLDVRNGIDILIEDSPELLAQRTIELLKSPQQQAAIAENGFRLVEQKYSLEANRDLLQKLCNQLLRKN